MSTVRSIRILHRHALIGIAVGALVGLTGCASASIVHQTDSPVTPPAGATQPERGATNGTYGGRVGPRRGRTAEQATRRVLEGLAGFPVKALSLIDRPGAAGNGPGTSLPWVSLDLDRDKLNSLEADWLGSLAQGAVADLMRTDQAMTRGVIGGGQITDSGSSSHPEYLGTGAVAAGQIFASPDDADLSAHVERVAERFGLTVTSLTILHPLDSAIAVTFRLPADAKVDWTIGELGSAIEGSPKTLEGSYIELDSSSGQPLLRCSGAHRVGRGDLWFAPGQDDRFGAIHSSPAFTGTGGVHG